MFILRRITENDIEALAQLVGIIEAADEGLIRLTAEILAELETAAAELVQAGWLAQIESGQVAGYNYVELVRGAELNFWLRGAVHPAWRGQGIGHQLIWHSWADMQQQRSSTGGETAWVNAWAYEHDRPRCRLLARFGLRPYHIYHKLEIPAAHIEAIPAPPPGVIIRPWDNRYCEAAVSLRNRAFAQNWGYQPTTAAALRRRFETARYESPFSFTAWRQTAEVDEELVGLIHACLGWTRQLRRANEGEIVWVAVAEEVRGQGIGRALMLTAMKALREAGVETISVGADNYADRPEIGLYTKLGFTVRKAIVDYRGEL
jgi:mycothiol synthase